jgi:hypothetical protein
MTKGIKVDAQTGKGPELMFVGDLRFDSKANRYIMNKPNLIIGSDRLDFYEFLGRRREVF